MNASMRVLAVLVAFGGCGGNVDGDSKGAEPKLEASLVSSNVVFCFCRHGCGPGLDGYIRVLVRNTGPDAVTFEPTALHFDGPSNFDVSDEGGLLGTMPATVAAGSSAEVVLTLQPDTASEFPTGTYQLGIQLAIGQRSASLPVGSVAIPFQPNDECGG
jgi:hypothetical protein